MTISFPLPLAGIARKTHSRIRAIPAYAAVEPGYPLIAQIKPKAQDDPEQK
jgi:hypothetical protein